MLFSKYKYCRLRVLNNTSPMLPLENGEEYINNLNKSVAHTTNNTGLMIYPALAIGTKECATFFHKDNVDFIIKFLRIFCSIAVEKEFVSSDEIKKRVSNET